MKKIRKTLAVTCLLTALPVGAAEIAGVTIPDKVKPAATETDLILNGAGVRRKFVFKIYVGALYLPAKAETAEAVAALDGPNRVLMHFLYDEVSKQKLTDGWWDGFKGNHGHEALEKLNGRIGEFTELFEDAHKGDQIWIDYLPEKGTRVTINGEVKGTIPGADFNQALLEIWLGKEPVTSSLKRAMLGQAE